jgi:intracellular multiplication protein IcmO
VLRVDWNNLTKLIEGQVILLLGGRLVDARLSHAQIADSGPKRLGRTLRLRPPDPGAIRARRDRTNEIGRRSNRSGSWPVSQTSAPPALSRCCAPSNGASGLAEKPRGAWEAYSRKSEFLRMRYRATSPHRPPMRRPS